MDIQEIKNYLSTSREKTVTIDCCLMREYGAVVREVKITSEEDVVFCLNAYGFDEGGIDIKFNFKSMEIMIFELEIVLGKSIVLWENFNKTGAYPSELDNHKANWDLLKRDLKIGRLKLPKNFQSIFFQGL